MSATRVLQTPQVTNATESSIANVLGSLAFNTDLGLLRTLTATSTLKSIPFADGTGATGTWDINITGTSSNTLQDSYDAGIGGGNSGLINIDSTQPVIIANDLSSTDQDSFAVATTKDPSTGSNTFGYNFYGSDGSGGFVKYGRLQVSNVVRTLGAEFGNMTFQVRRNGIDANWFAYTSQDNTIYLGFTGTTYNLPGYSTGVLLATDINQNIVPASGTYGISISGNAATATILQTARSIYGNSFNGSADLTQIIASTYGGTGNGFTKFSGATTTEKTYTLPNASCAILTDNALVTGAQGGTGVNNSGKTITIGGNVTFSGAFASTFTFTNTTSVTFPTSGTLATTAGTVASITGTANQVLANGTSGSAQTGAVTLTLPQSIATSSTPTFGGLTITGTGAKGASITSTTTGGSGDCTFDLKRADISSANLSRYYTGSSIDYQVGSAAGTSRYTIQDGVGNYLLQLSSVGEFYLPAFANHSVVLTASGGQLYTATGTTGQVLVMGASDPAFGAVDLANSSAVTGVLPNANTTATASDTVSTIVARNSNGITALRGLTFSNYTIASTTPLVSFSINASAGNYINYGLGGRNIGVTSGGTIFISRNIDYDVGSSAYKYTNSAAATVIELALNSGALKYAASGTAGNTATTTNALLWDSSGNINIPILTASQAVVTDGSKNLVSLQYTNAATASTIMSRDASANFAAAGATLTSLSVSSTGSVFGTIASTTTGSLNEGGLNLVRGDQANGYAQTHYKTGATDKWATGLRTGDDKYYIYDVVNSLNTAIFTAGTGTTSSLTLLGTLNAANYLISSTGTVQPIIQSTTTGSLNNADLWLKRGDAANGYTRVLYNDGSTLRWGLGMRAASSNFLIYDETNSLSLVTVTAGSGVSSNVSFAGSVTIANDLTLNSSNAIINTAGKTLKVKQGSNACFGTGAVLVGGTVTISTTAVSTGDTIFLSCTAAGGTQGIPRISAISNNTSFTITSSNGADTSTYSWLIIKAA